MDAATSKPWKTGDRILRGHNLHYLRTGSGDQPALVLVHGFSDNGATWSAVAREMESEWDVIMPDMRGHGESARVLPDDDLDMAADLAALIDDLGLRSPVICGHSMGAMVSFQACLQRPGLARALILEDPPWFSTLPPPSPSPNASEPPIVAWAKTLPRKTLEELVVQYRRDNPTWSEETIRAMCLSKKQLDQGVVDRLSARLSAQEPDWRAGVSRLSLPTLLFSASPEKGGIVSKETVDEVHKLNPGITIRTFPEVGHLIRFDAQARFVSEMKRFLASLPGIRG